MKQFIKSRMLPRIKMIMLAKHFMAYFSFCTFLFPIQYHYFAIFFFATSFITFLFSNSLFLFFFICRSGSCCFFRPLSFISCHSLLTVILLQFCVVLFLIFVLPFFIFLLLVALVYISSQKSLLSSPLNHFLHPHL